ncbi:glyoxylase-like metal-dependent hydrolase (beta-lactamase superfamily II) [Desulfohalotomaculum tongense]|uniref:MBL fold metallo-hydrolase n=1 Tax=Desulforadius tongensis TaxID=1216062 RepID=UPI00195968AA|nr:MBL fold metallo-hydrolase [Desulforadius tongensis]MBM7855006.1 glyoxylase-like metal-dependent hydrolase (beta-lactamase superfamily II) [Desulforadius tongensis]
MIVEVLPVGQLDANCYILACEETKEAAVIDPGGDAEDILNLLNLLAVKPKYIICTHGHADHIAAVDRVKAATGAKVLVHSADAEMFGNPQKNLSVFLGQNVTLQPADQLLCGGEIIKLGSLELEVISVPGHTEGGICIKVENAVFTGDTLFAGSVGRSDFPGGDHRQLIKGIKEKLLVLPGETRVYPGHGPDTLIEQEKRHNPFIQ